MSSDTEQHLLKDHGAINCILVYADRKHIDYINNILIPIEEYLSANGFRVHKVGDTTKPDESFGQHFEELCKQISLGIVVLDGFRPNVIYEYGFLRARGIPVLLLQDKKGKVAIKSYYGLDEPNTEAACKKLTGLTVHQFGLLKEPPISYMQLLSDRHGVNVLIADSGASNTSPDHPKQVLCKALISMMPDVLNVQKHLIVLDSTRRSGGSVTESVLKRLSDLVQEVSDYYGRVRDFDQSHIESIVQEIESLEGSGATAPPSLLSMIAAIHATLAERDTDAGKDHLYSAIGLYKKIIEGDSDSDEKAEAFKRTGDVFLQLSSLENDKAQRIQDAIHSYEQCLSLYNPEVTPIDYASALNNLAVAYQQLAAIQDTIANAHKALETSRKALTIYVLPGYALQHAQVHSNMSASCRILGDSESLSYLNEAISHSNIAVQIYRERKMVKEYAIALTNMGNNYLTLAEYRLGNSSSSKAIRCYKIALKIFQGPDFIQYRGKVLNNMANAYRLLAERKDTIGNAQMAIEYAQKALKLRPQKLGALPYATSLTTLGVAYEVFSSAQSDKRYCQMAIKRHKEALQSAENLPVPAATIYFHLGRAYETLAKMENPQDNLQSAIDSYNMAGSGLAKEHCRVLLGQLHFVLGRSHLSLGDYSPTAFVDAERYFQSALGVFTEKESPAMFKAITGMLKQAQVKKAASATK